MIRVFCACTLAITSSLAVFSQSPNGRHNRKAVAETEVITFFDALTNAGLKRDVTALDRLYSDNYFHTNPDGSIMTKAQVLASYKSPPGPATIDSDQHDEDRVWIKGNLAVLNTLVTIKGRFNEEPYARRYRITYLFEKRQRHWVAITSHATLILQSAR